MCGGRGTRLDSSVEKPLVSVGGLPMVERVISALEGSIIETVYAATSPNAPATAARLDVPRVETPGEGYVSDLNAALASDRLSLPLLTVAADLPLLEAPVIDEILSAHRGSSMTVAVPAGRARACGFTVETTIRHRGTHCRPAGVNVVDGDDDAVCLSRDRRLAANVNTRRDYLVAEWLLAHRKRQ